MEGAYKENHGETGIPDAESLAQAIEGMSTLESTDKVENEGQLRLENIRALSSESIALLKKTASKLSDVKEEDLSPEKKIEWQKIKEKTLNVVKKFLRITQRTILVGSVLAVGNYYRTHDSLTKTTNEKGEFVYHHPDRETDHLLNVMAGREKMTLGDKLIEYMGLFEEILKKRNIEIPSNFRTMSLDELDAFLFTTKIDTGMHRGDLKKDLEREVEIFNGNFSDTTSNFKAAKNLYDLVWRLEEECGNPRIKFESEDIHFTPIKDYQGARHYDPVNNIIYVSFWDLGRWSNHAEASLMAEMSHAKQFNDNQVTTYLNMTADFLSVLTKSGFTIDSIADNYKKTYDNPGTFEHEAHRIIQPYLEKKYQLYVRKDEPKK